MEIALIGGIWLSLLYSSTVVPASVWVIQITVTRGWTAGLFTGASMSLGQFPWSLAASLLLFQVPSFWQSADLFARILAAVFLLWMAYRTAKASEVGRLQTEAPESRWRIGRISLWRSLAMPWRLPLWAALIISVSAHLRGPGWQAALWFAVGSVAGQFLWHAHFVVVAGLFGHRVPEPISLRSLNKLRLLATIVLAGLALIILAPLAFPPI